MCPMHTKNEKKRYNSHPIINAPNFLALTLFEYSFFNKKQAKERDGALAS